MREPPYKSTAVAFAGTRASTLTASFTSALASIFTSTSAANTRSVNLRTFHDWDRRVYQGSLHRL